MSVLPTCKTYSEKKWKIKHDTSLGIKYWQKTLCKCCCCDNFVNSFLFQLHEFLSPLNDCRGSSIFKIRELAAKALVSILQKSSDNLEQLASKITPEVCATTTTNQRHGNLLQVSHNNTSLSLKNSFLLWAVLPTLAIF